VPGETGVTNLDLDTYDQQLLTAVVERAERAGKRVVPLIVPTNNPLYAIIAASGVILTAGYILWAVQRVYLGAEYKGPHGEHLAPSDLRENLIGTVLCVFAILFGVFPYQFPGGRPSVLKYMDATIDAQVQDLADWTREEEANSRAAAVSTRWRSCSASCCSCAVRSRSRSFSSTNSL
jgi:hypothetical protein